MLASMLTIRNYKIIDFRFLYLLLQIALTPLNLVSKHYSQCPILLLKAIHTSITPIGPIQAIAFISIFISIFDSHSHANRLLYPSIIHSDHKQCIWREIRG